MLKILALVVDDHWIEWTKFSEHSRRRDLDQKA
jgi:hypothetical protein